MSRSFHGERHPAVFALFPHDWRVRKDPPYISTCRPGPFGPGGGKCPHNIVAFLVQHTAHDEDTRRAKQIQKTDRRTDKHGASEIRGDDVCFGQIRG